MRPARASRHGLLFSRPGHDSARRPASVCGEGLRSAVPSSPWSRCRTAFVDAAPMIRNGYVTFGVFNRIDKISDPRAGGVVEIAAGACPDSIIMIKNGALNDALVRDNLIAPLRCARRCRRIAFVASDRPRATSISRCSPRSTSRSIRSRRMAASSPGSRCRWAFPSSPSSASAPASRAGGCDRQGGRSRRLGRRG